jgi:hypothetical protein
MRLQCRRRRPKKPTARASGTNRLCAARQPGKWLIHCHIGHHTTNNNVETQGGGGLMLITQRKQVSASLRMAGTTRIVYEFRAESCRGACTLTAS